jgi:hypothetical protein
MTGRFLFAMVFGAVVTFATLEANAAACCKFERAVPTSCWFFCKPAR